MWSREISIYKFTTTKKCPQSLQKEYWYLAKVDCRYNKLCDRCTIIYHLQLYSQKHVRMLLNQRDRLLFSIFEGDSLTELIGTLLKLGKPINLKDTSGFNSLTLLLEQNSHQKLQNPVSDLQINPQPALILFVVGEVVQLEHLKVNYTDNNVTTAYIQEYIIEGLEEFTLQNECRKSTFSKLTFMYISSTE